MDDLTLSADTILEPGAACLLTRATLARKRPRQLHGHDFHELLWVQNGRARHHLPEGRGMLEEGDVAFLRPGDRHGLQALAEETMVVSVTLRPSVIDGIGARHEGLAGRWFWSGAAAPEVARRDPARLAELNRAALRLERAEPTALEVEAFLMPLLAALGDGREDGAAPDWLIAACAAARDPQVFRAGAAGFVRAAGKAHPHVSRMARRYLGQSPSDYVNARRMDFAARRLRRSGDSLAEIAGACGIGNLSHFHRLFRGRYGETPQRYRRAVQRDVVQP